MWLSHGKHGTLLLRNNMYKKKVVLRTLGPGATKPIIPGIGLIWAPLSLSITWKLEKGQISDYTTDSY